MVEHGPVTPAQLAKRQCLHEGTQVMIGGYPVILGGKYLDVTSGKNNVDALITLSGYLPLDFGAWCVYPVLHAPLVDFGGVPSNWHDFLADLVIPELERNTRFAAFCVGGHGRTGVFAASLIALLESPADTPDPIEAIRQRYCPRAVEVYEQAQAVFDLRGEDLPTRYQHEFSSNKRRH